MKDIRRLKTGALLSNSPTGAVRVAFVDFDGGDFELHPKQTDDGLFLVDPNRPNAYSFELTGDTDALDRISKALAAIVRSRRSPDDEPAPTVDE